MGFRLKEQEEAQQWADWERWVVSGPGVLAAQATLATMGAYEGKKDPVLGTSGGMCLEGSSGALWGRGIYLN